MRVVTTVLASALLVAGCDSTDSGTPTAESAGASATAETTTPTPEGFDPCRNIPDEALGASGVDPATEEKDISDVEFEGWKLCTWTAPWYFLTIYLADIGMELGVMQNRQFAGFEPVRIAGRDAVRFHTTYDRPGDGCYVAFPSKFGAVIFAVSAKQSAERLEDTCRVVDRQVVELNRYVPE